MKTNVLFGILIGGLVGIAGGVQIAEWLVR